MLLLGADCGVEDCGVEDCGADCGAVVCGVACIGACCGALCNGVDVAGAALCGVIFEFVDVSLGVVASGVIALFPVLGAVKFRSGALRF